MTSPAQVAANQTNAQSSTGPRTPEGKARLSQNALRHGRTAQHLVIRPEEREEFAAFEDSLATELDRQGVYINKLTKQTQSEVTAEALSA